MAFLLGIDVGTSGTKTALFDEYGNTIISHTAEYPLYQPHNGWAEQNPADWWNAVCETVRTVLRGVDAKEVRGVGLSGQMHGLVMLDANGETLRPAILWCDGRTAAECAEITELVGARRLIELSANPALPGFTAGKILWVRKHEPEVYEKCRHILLPKDYIRYKLTGEFATEVSDASGMNLLDVPNRRWSGEILEKLSIDKALLPEMYESSDAAGTVCESAAAETGLSAGTIVAGGAGDNAAAAVGMGVVSAGRAFTTIGTSGVIFAHSDTVTIDPDGRVHTFCSAVPGAWAVMSCTLAAGLSLPEKEAAELIGRDAYELMDQAAKRIPIGANRLLYLPYLMGERSPILDSGARGAFIGLSAVHTKADMLRAVMEGVAYSQRQCLDVLLNMGVCFDKMLICGGGGKSAFWRQMLADVYGVPVSAIASEGPALGAVILAGTASGIYKSVQEGCDVIIKTAPIQEPIRENSERYTEFYDIYKELYPALKGSFIKIREA